MSELKGCKVCNDSHNLVDIGPHEYLVVNGTLYFNDSTCGLEGSEANYCPMCGRRLDGKEDTRAQPSEALTVEELAQFGDRPYWHKSLGGNEDKWDILPKEIASRVSEYGYGKTWLAYRRKPEEG